MINRPREVLERDAAPNGALPAISIVTPSFNRKDYLAETMESVLGQGYPKLEYVVVDGGSTDGSAELIETTCVTSSLGGFPNRTRARGRQSTRGSRTRLVR